MSDELKPCPFCGQPAVGGNWPYVPQSDNKQSGMVAVAMCENTACRVQPELTLYSEGGFPEETGTWEDVLAEWNTRPVEDALRAEVMRLNAQYYEMDTYGCPDCNGDGDIKGTTCFTCNGHGVLYTKPKEATE